MSREEERNTTAHKIAWEYTKHYDPLLSKESWCEMAVRDAIDWFDQHPREGLWDAEKVITWIALHAELYGGFNQGKLNSMCEDLRKAMED